MILSWAAIACLAMLPQEPVHQDFALRNGDRVVFYGDTLIHKQLFSTYVETFVRVRYPTLDTRFINAGLEGQTAADGLGRMQTDLVPLSPTVVVVCFGLHDPDRRPLDEQRLSDFRLTYHKMIQGVQQLGARVIMLTPPRPVPDRLRFIEVPAYEKVIGRYAQVIRELAAETKSQLVDWYRIEQTLQERPGKVKRKRRNRASALLPQPLSHAAAAAALLKAWGAAPIQVTLDVDWATGRATASQGSVSVLDHQPSKLSLDLKQMPLPWALAGVRAADLEGGDWPGADLCQYVLKVRNAPTRGLHLLWRSKPIPLDAEKLAGGLNIVHWQPLRLMRALSDFKSYVRDKHLWRLRMISPRRPKEVELQHAFDTYMRSLELYEEGTREIILRLPKTFDVQLHIEENAPEPASTPTSDGASSGS